MYTSYSANQFIIGEHVWRIYTDKHEAPNIFTNLLLKDILVNNTKNRSAESIISGLLQFNHWASFLDINRTKTIAATDNMYKKNALYLDRVLKLFIPYNLKYLPTK